jgi:hypothetical protein
MNKRKNILIDELIVALRVPRELSEAESRIIRGMLMQAGFLRRVRQAVRDVLKQYTALSKVRITLAR